MLIIGRRVGQGFTIDKNIKIAILRNYHGNIQLGIDAPPEILILRNELIKKGEFIDNREIITSVFNLHHY